MAKNNKTIAKETLGILEDGFTSSKKIHPGYSEYENAKKNHNLAKFHLKQCFGKWQYFFEKGNFKISLIKINDFPLRGEKDNWIWEIYAFEDNRLFEDVKKFQTKKEAMKTVRSILGD